MSKHKEMKTRLGWTISYKSLYFVHPSLELVPLFTGMRERSITDEAKISETLFYYTDQVILILDRAAFEADIVFPALL